MEKEGKRIDIPWDELDEWIREIDFGEDEESRKAA